MTVGSGGSVVTAYDTRHITAPHPCPQGIVNQNLLLSCDELGPDAETLVEADSCTTQTPSLNAISMLVA